MTTSRRGFDLKIHITLAAASLGRKVATKRKTISELQAMLSELRREQIDRGINLKVERVA